MMGILMMTGAAFAQTPDLNTILNRMQTAMHGRNQDRAYAVTREYKLTSDDPSKTGRVVAEVITAPSGKKNYNITQGDGQAEKVVRKVLDHETESANQDHSGYRFSPENYEFAYLGSEVVDGHSCYILQLTPRHEGRDMVKGRAWVDAQSYMVRQIAGSPTKTPSWWIKDLQVTLHYKDIDGLWLQDSAEAVAQVRLVGRHVLTSRAMNVRSDFAVAAKTEPDQRKRTRRTDPALLGAGVFARH